MKYTATEKNELLPTGTEFEFVEMIACAVNDSRGWVVHNLLASTWVTTGKCKEVQEKWFTKDDMIEFAKYSNINTDGRSYNKKFEDWMPPDNL